MYMMRLVLELWLIDYGGAKKPIKSLQIGDYMNPEAVA